MTTTEHAQHDVLLPDTSAITAHFVGLEAGRIADDEYELAVTEAVAESDAVVIAQCVCDKCDKVIATVSRTRRGLLFSSSVTAFDAWPQLPERHRQALARRPLTYVVHTLLDHPDADQHDRPRAGCPKHGERHVDTAVLLGCVRRARLGKKMRVILKPRDSSL